MPNEAARKRILVIDDDQDVLISLECLLENEGYETTTAWSGQEGLALLRSREFDLVMLDDYLRDIEHEAIFREIRGMGIQPLVVLTESTPIPDATRHFFDMGASAVVNKWAPCEKIAAEVRRCLTGTASDPVAA